VTGGATTAWNPSDKDADLVLSGGNLIATGGGGANNVQAVRAVASSASGKKYYECRLTAFLDNAAISMGIGNSSASLSGLVGANLDSVGCITNGEVRINNRAVDTIDAYALNDWVGIAADLTAELIWFKNITDGGNWNADAGADPATGTGGISFASLNAGRGFR
jgi:hypothetical protein